MDLWGWAILLLAIGVLLAFLEVFLPSGGLIGTLAFLAVVAAVVMAFRHGPLTGLGVAGASLILVPVALGFAFHFWPKTPIGRRVLLRVPDRQEVLPLAEMRQSLRALVGKTGYSRSLMLPSGAVEIAGRTYDALSEGVAIEPGHPVRVVEVRGTRLVVRPIDEQDSAPIDDRDPLSRPIEELGIDPFDEPLV